jgi:hypothetical protein
MDKLKRIEDQIRHQERLIGLLRWHLSRRRSPESCIPIAAQLTHALAGLAVLCRVDEADKRSGDEAVESQLMALPIGTLLLTPDDVSEEFLTYLEKAGIESPDDDLEFVVITDPSLVPRDIDAELSVGSFGGKTDYWALDERDPLWSILARSASIGNSIEWYKVEFSNGWKAVGICSH